MKTAKDKAPLPNRRLTVCNKHFDRNNLARPCATFPVILLTGKWLQQTGFTGGQILNVQCENRRLVITVEQDPE